MTTLLDNFFRNHASRTSESLVREKSDSRFHLCRKSPSISANRNRILLSVSPLAVSAIASFGFYAPPAEAVCTRVNGNIWTCHGTSSQSSQVRMSATNGHITVRFSSNFTHTRTQNGSAFHIYSRNNGVRLTQSGTGGDIKGQTFGAIRAGGSGGNGTINVAITSPIITRGNSLALNVFNRVWNQSSYSNGAISVSLDTLSSAGSGIKLNGGGLVTLTAKTISATSGSAVDAKSRSNGMSITLSTGVLGNNNQSVIFANNERGFATINAGSLTGGNFGINFTHEGHSAGTVNISAGSITTSSTNTGEIFGIRVQRNRNAGGATIISAGAISGTKSGIWFKGEGSSLSATILPKNTITAVNTGVYAKAGSGVIIQVTPPNNNTDAKITSTSGDAIVAHGTGTLTILTPSTLSAAKAAIKVTNSSTTSATVIRTSTATSSGNADSVIDVTARGGAISITASNAITGGKNRINVVQSGAGAITVTAKNVTAGSATSSSYGVKIKRTGNAGTVNVTTDDVTFADSGIYVSGASSVTVRSKLITVNKAGININANGAITIGSISSSRLNISALGTTSDEAIKIVRGNASTGDISVSVGNVSSNKSAIDIRNSGAVEISLNSTGRIESIGGGQNNGINIVNDSAQAGRVIGVLNEVRGTGSGVYIKHTGSGGGVTLTFSGDVTAAAGDGIKILHQGSGAVTIIAATVSASNRGIFVETTGATGNIVVNLYEGTSNRPAVAVYNSGAGNITLTSTGTLTTNGTSQRWNGVVLKQTRSTGGSITALVKNVNARGTGIYTSNWGGETTIKISGTVSAQRYGVFAENRRNGHITVTLASGASITTASNSNGKRGIRAVKAVSSTGNVVVSSSGTISSALDGIYAVSRNGSVHISARGDITAGTNSGASNVAAMKIYSIGGDANISIHSGTITGGSGSGAKSIQHVSGVSNVRLLGGTLASPVNLGSQDDRFVLSGGTISGDVDLGAHNDTFQVNSGTISSSVTITGGSGADTLTLNASGTFSSSQFTNFENVLISSGVTVKATASGFGFTNITNNGTLDLSNSSAGDSITSVTSLSGTGLIILDASFTGTSATVDSFTISNGTLSGTLKVRINDISPTGSRQPGPFTIFSVTGTGTVSSGAISFESGNSLRSGNYVYTLTYDSSNRSYKLTGRSVTGRPAITRCTESGTSGVFTCSGAISKGEVLEKSGSVGIEATLESTATVNVSADVAFLMNGSSTITFTQESGGGSLTGSGYSPGIFYANTTTSSVGAGIAINVVGAISLDTTDSSGIAIHAKTVNPNITISTANTITASGSGVKGIVATSSAGDVTLKFAKSVTTSGDAITVSTGGAVTVNVTPTDTNTTATIISNSGNAIKVEGGEAITISAPQTVSALSTAVSVKNTSSASATTLTLSTATSRGTTTPVIKADISGALNITAGNISGGTHGISATSSGTGAISLTTGNISLGTENNSVGIKVVRSSATGTITISAGTISGSKYGIELDNSGSMTISAGNITVGSATAALGVKVIQRAGGTPAAISITTGTISGGKYGIDIFQASSGTITISAGNISTGGITGARGLDIQRSHSSGVTNVHASDITSSGQGLKVTGGEITITANVISAGTDGIYASNQIGSISVTASGNITAGTTNPSAAFGIKVLNPNGSVTITANSGTTISATGTSATGIYTKGSGAVTIKAATVKGKTHGIYVSTKGVVSIGPSNSTTLLKVTATSLDSHNAIYVKQGTNATGNITISAFDAVSKEAAVRVSNHGTGNVSITSSGLMQTRGIEGRIAVLARNWSSSGGHITISVKNVSGTSMGIYSENRGNNSNITISASGAINAHWHGISAKLGGVASGGASNISITLATGASITTSSFGAGFGGSGIIAYVAPTRTGAVTINTSGSIDVAGNGIAATSRNRNVTITVNGDISAGRTIDTATAIKVASINGNASITINGGTIAGGSGATAKSITHGSGAATVVLAGGTIVDPVSLGYGNDYFRIRGGTLSGNVDLGAGNDEFSVSSGTINSGLTIDGGAGTDQINFTAASATLSLFTNFERLSIGENVSVTGSAHLDFSSAVINNGIIDLSDGNKGQSFTPTTNLSGNGVIILDAHLSGSSPATDTLTFSGNLSGSQKIRLIDRSTAGQTRSAGPFTIATVTGTTSSTALSLENGTFVSGGFAYTLTYNASNKSFVMSGARANLRCVENSATVGTFDCAGLIDVPETISKAGATARTAATTNVVTTLDRTATVTISEDVAFRNVGANNVTFTQETGGGSLTGTGATVGLVHGQTTGTGNVSLTLVGAVSVTTISTAVKAIYAKGSTGNVTISAPGALTVKASGGSIRGIEAIATTGNITISTSATITVSGTGGDVKAIVASATTGDISILTPSAVSVSASTTNGIPRVIEADATTGDVTISASGTVTLTTSGTGQARAIDVETTTGDISINVAGTISVSNTALTYGIIALSRGGDITINTKGIEGATSKYTISANNSSSSAGDINITNTGNLKGKFYIHNSGNNSITINTSGNIEGSGHSAIYANHYGNGSITVTHSGNISGTYYGIYVEGQGSLTVNVTDGDISTISGNGVDYAGIYVKNSSNATGPITVNIASGASVTGGGKGVYLWDFGSTQDITLTAIGAITGLTSNGILVYQKSSGDVTISAHTVTSSAGRGIGVYLARSGNSSGAVTGAITLVSGGSITSSNTGIYVEAGGGTGINTVISAYGSVTVSSTNNSADAIHVKQTSSGGGTVSISATGNLSTSGRHGVHIRADGSGGDKTITTGGTIAAKQRGIYVKSSQSGGSITISATGAITASGKHAIAIDPRGPGAMSITTASVTAGNYGVYIDSGYDRGTSGDISVTVTGNIVVTGADTNAGSAGILIDMEGDHGGDITISVTGDVSSTGSGMRIGHYGDNSSGDVNVSMSGTMTAGRDGIVVFASGNHDISVTFTGTMSVTGDAIELYLDDGYSGNLTLVANGSFTTSGTTGTTALSAYNESSGNTSITVSGTVKSAQDYGVFQRTFSGDVTFVSQSGSVIEGKKAGVSITNKRSNANNATGSSTITASGSIRGGLSSSTARNGLEVRHYGTNLVLSAEDVEGSKHGIEAIHGKDGSTSTGTFTVTVTGDVTASGAGAEYGIFLRSFSSAPTVSLTINSGASVTGVAGGIKVETVASSGMTISTSGAISGTRNGIVAINSSGNNSLTIANNVTATASGAKGISLFTNNGTSTVVINSGTITAEVAISDDESSTSITVNSGATISGEVRLSGGVDILTFESGSSFDRTKILDGGKDAGNDTSIDVLTLNSGRGTLETTKWINWERIVLGTGTKFTVDGTQTINTNELNVAGTISLADNEVGDSLAIASNFTGDGVVEIDVDFSAGTTDSISISGNVTGTKTIKLVDLAEFTDRTRADEINIITVQGTVSADAFTIGDSDFVSGAYKYKLIFNAATKTFTLSGETRNIKCVATVINLQTYNCTGKVVRSEYFYGLGSTSLVASLSGNTTSEVTTGRAFNLKSKAGITITQSADGGELKGSGAATGIILASTSGNGNISISLTGTASLEGNGKTIEAKSTGNGNVVVKSTAKVEAQYPAATAVFVTGKGARVEVDVNEVDAGSMGVSAKNENGATIVQTRGAVTSSGTGVYAYSKSAAVTVNTRQVSATKDAIIATNSGGTGDVSITSSGSITSQSGIAISARVQGSGAITINLSGDVAATSSTAIRARHDNSGAINITTAHAVTGGSTGAAIDTTTSGSTTITLNRGANISANSGVAINNGEGPSTITVNAGVTIAGSIVLGGGDDRLTFASNSFGTSLLDGGAGSSDILTINSGDVVMRPSQFLNWEQIIMSDQSSLIIRGEHSLEADSLTVKGTLNLQDGEANDTLTVSGAFVGGGRVLIDVDFSAGNTDKLVINGTVSDKTTVSIRDISRSGGRLISIPIISVQSAASSDAFALDKIYSSGGVSYTMRYDASQRSFYLARPFTGPMLTAMPITLFDAFARAPSLHQRLGGRHLQNEDGSYRKSSWTRVISGNRKYGTMSDGASEFETATLGYQAGFDIAVLDIAEGVWIFSLTAQNSTIETDIVTNRENGLFESAGTGVGVTATWYRNDGLYLDLQSQFNQIKTDLSSTNSQGILDGDVASAQFISFEVGQRMQVSEDVTLVAQFQTSWGRVISRTVNAPNGRAEFGLEGGGTLRLGGGAEFGQLGETMFEGYVRGNIYHDTMDSWDVNFASRTFSDEIETPTAIEIVAGGSLAITDSAMLFMQGTYRNSVGGNFPDGAERPSFGDLSAGFRWSW